MQLTQLIVFDGQAPSFWYEHHAQYQNELADTRPAPTVTATRSYASSSEPDLKETLKNAIPAKRELLKKVKAHADKKLGDVKVENTLGGMRYASQAPQPS